MSVHVGDAEAAAHGAYASMHARPRSKSKKAALQPDLGLDFLEHLL